MFTKIICVYIIISHLTYPARCSKMTEGLNAAGLLENEIVFRIEHGREAKLGDVPYLISFKLRSERGNYNTYCGGTLIEAAKIISAAHCFVIPSISKCFESGVIKKNKLADQMAVAGLLRRKVDYKYEDTKENGQWRELQKVNYPLTYAFPNNDIAVVHTSRPFVFNKYVKPIPYAVNFKEYSGTCLASGFGRINKTMKTNKLLLVELKIIPTSKCELIHRKSMKSFVCTSSRSSDVGKGDSGGPLVCRGTGDPNESKIGILVGVTSGKKRNKLDGTVFTRVSSFAKFIKGKSDLPKATSIMFNMVYPTRENWLDNKIELQIGKAAQRS